MMILLILLILILLSLSTLSLKCYSHISNRRISSSLSFNTNTNTDSNTNTNVIDTTKIEPNNDSKIKPDNNDNNDNNDTNTTITASTTLSLSLSQIKPFLDIAVPFFKEDKVARNSLGGVIALTLLNSGNNLILSSFFLTLLMMITNVKVYLLGLVMSVEISIML